MTSATNQTPVADNIISSLKTLKPIHIELINESMQHAGYFEGKESHFKLTIISEDFLAKRLIARHQLVYAVLNHLLTSAGGSVHALALHTYTDEEWKGMSPDSPKCLSNR